MQNQLSRIGTYLSHNQFASRDHTYGNHTNYLLLEIEGDGN